MTTPNLESSRRSRVAPILSLRTRDGILIEAIFKREEGRTALAAFRSGSTSEQDSIILDGLEYVPYSAKNNLLTHRVVLLPSAVGSYRHNGNLVEEVREFIHRYVDLSPGFEEVASHYVLLTWIFDAFNELPYLRVRGQYGSGKSRFLLTIGSICYKPIFASGASTVSPIFRLIDQVAGTLVIDEADFFSSDERSEIVKILNNGNARGFPVLRSDVTPSKEFNPRAFNIFGPKIVATRHRFEDAALESRCFTEVLGNRPLRPDIPISLPHAFEAEAEELRNKLLTFRFQHLAGFPEPIENVAHGLDPRRAQILAPLLSVAFKAEARERLFEFVERQAGVQLDSRAQVEKCVLSSVSALLVESVPLTLASIAARFQDDWKHRYGAEVSHRWLGSVLRRLGIALQKSNGVYMIHVAEYPRLHDILRDLGFETSGTSGTTSEGVERPDPSVA